MVLAEVPFAHVVSRVADVPQPRGERVFHPERQRALRRARVLVVLRHVEREPTAEHARAGGRAVEEDVVAVELDSVVRHQRVHPRRERVRVVPARVRPADVVSEDDDDVRTVRTGLVVREGGRAREWSVCDRRGPRKRPELRERELHSAPRADG